MSSPGDAPTPLAMLERIDASGPSALLLLALGACGAAEDPRQPARPGWNVLLVTLDTTRPDWLGCYGSGTSTPHIDQVAADGARFERCISTSGITPTSHASILTGLNNYRHGLRVFHSDEVSHALDAEVDTLPEVLHERAGYATGAMLSAYAVSEVYDLNQGFEDFASGTDAEALAHAKQPQRQVFFDRSGASSSQRRSDRTVAGALGWLELRATDDRKWMLWLHLFDVHDSRHPGARSATRCASSSTAPS